ncbi:MAG: transcriptional repressor [Bdellovibrionales bacterium]|nr:transcriptional repressor [Bdellovibrionales bacterium]
MKGRNAQVSRIVCLIAVLDRHPAGMTVKEMYSSLESRGFRVSKRTIYRDLEALAQAGLPLFMDEDTTAEGTTRWKFPHKIKAI